MLSLIVFKQVIVLEYQEGLSYDIISYRLNQCRRWTSTGGTPLQAQSGLWKPAPSERLDSPLLWSCRREKRRADVLESYLVNERSTSPHFRVRARSRCHFGRTAVQNTWISWRHWEECWNVLQTDDLIKLKTLREFGSSSV